VSPSVRGLAAVLIVALTSTALAAEIVPPATRDVTPSDMTPGPKGEGPLVREPAPPRPPDPARWRRFFLPVTTDAATLVVKDLTIHIAGVTALAEDETCPLADGTEWPCGRTALYRFRLFLHGRAVECYFPYAGDVADITAPCRLAKTDLALWLLQQGWVRPSDLATDAYRTASAKARCSHLGIWRDAARPSFCPQG